MLLTSQHNNYAFIHLLNIIIIMVYIVDIGATNE